MSLTQGLHRAMQQRPDRTAIRFAEREVDYATLGDGVARLAGALRELGLGEGDRVAMLALNSDRYLEYYLATPWAGGVLNPVNIRWSADEIAYSLDDSGSEILLVDDAFAEIVPRLRQRTDVLREVVHIGDGPTPEGMRAYGELVQAADPPPDAGRAGDDLAGVFYTGGTTGFPKGVMLTHGGIWASSMALLAEGIFPPGSIFLHAAPMFHIGSAATLITQFIRGGTHAVVPSFEPVAVMRAIERFGVVETFLVPTMLQMLVDHPALGDHDLGSLERIVYGASPIAEAVLERTVAALPEVELVQAYGQTELSPMCTVLSGRWHGEEGRAAGRTRAAGRATFCVHVKIVDADDEELPRGEVGEIVARGPNVMAGYWDRPEETAAALRDGWMHTGDAGWMDDDGFVYIVDRLKDMIITGGENVFSAEVENALASHPEVAACAIIGIPDDDWGEAVHAVVVPQSGCEPTLESIRAHCRERIAGYKCPRSLELRDELPLSAAGKVLKTELRAPYWADADRGVH